MSCAGREISSSMPQIAPPKVLWWTVLDCSFHKVIYELRKKYIEREVQQYHFDVPFPELKQAIMDIIQEFNAND